MKLSLIVLTRNAQSVVENNLKTIKEYLENLEIISEYEVIVSDYSEDNTFKILKKIEKADSTVRCVKAPRRGIGCGLKTGFDIARLDYLMFYPIDMAWKIDIIKDSLEKLNQNYDVVLGSRWIVGSHTNRPIKREIFSKAYNTLINLLFNLKIRDTQGTIALRHENYLKFNNNLRSDGPFLQTEILIYSKSNNQKIIEISSDVIDKRNDSSVNVWSFGISMAIDAIKKKITL